MTIVAEVMSAPALSVAPDASVAAAWALMQRSGLRHLVVCRGDRCVGLIDDRSVFAQWPMGPLALRRHCVGELMRPSTSCVLADAPISEVALVMARDRIDAVPVVELDGTLVGIVTASDVIAAVSRTCQIHVTP
jgi:CBS domain-containing protein